jgi:hypothetical protein
VARPFKFGRQQPKSDGRGWANSVRSRRPRLGFDGPHSSSHSMLPYLSRVSLWLAALAAAASLFTSGREGAALATVAIIALIGALVIRRFQLKASEPVLVEIEQVRPLDDAAMLEVATLLSRRISQAATLLDALRETRDELVHELGARGVVVHGPTDDATPLVLAERFPLGEGGGRAPVARPAPRGVSAPVVRGALTLI